MILYFDAADNGSDNEGFDGNGFYLVGPYPRLHLIIRCTTMFSFKFSVLQAAFKRLNEVYRNV